MSRYGETGYGVEPYAGDENTGGGGGVESIRVQRWSLFEAGGQTYFAGNGITFDGTTFALEHPLSVANGGTGALDLDSAVDNLGLLTPYMSDLPALSAGVPCVVVHNLDSTNVGVQFRTTDDNDEISLDWAPLDNNTLAVYSGFDFDANAIRVEAVG